MNSDEREDLQQQQADDWYHNWKDQQEVDKYEALTDSADRAQS